MKQTNIIKPHSRHKRIFNEVFACLWQFLVIFVVIANNRKNFLCADVNGHTVRNFKAAFLAFVFVFKPFNVQFTIDFIDFTVAVLRTLRVIGNALLAVLRPLHRIQIAFFGIAQGYIPVHTKDLQPLDR